MGTVEHEERAASAFARVRCAVVAVSDTRTIKTDESGKIIRELLVSEGHEVHYRDVIPNEYEAIQDTLLFLLGRDLHCILFIGGTGLGRKDITVETITPFLEKRIDGFGEIFRMLSFQRIGAPAMLSRAVAGRVKECLVICLPGSKDAAELAVKELLLPQLKHLMWVITR